MARRSPLDIDRALVLRAGAPVLVLLVLLVVFKGLRLVPAAAASLATGGAEALLPVAAGAAGVLALGLLARPLGRGMRRRWLGRRWLGRRWLVGGLALAAVMVVEGAAWAASGAPQGVVLTSALYVQPDVLFAAGLFAAWLLVLAPLAGRARRAGVRLAAVVTAGLALAAGLELAYALRGESLAEWIVSAFPAQSVGAVGGALVREVSRGGWWVLLPPLVVGAAPLVGRHWRARRWIRQGRVRMRARGYVALAGAVGLLAVGGLEAGPLPRPLEPHRGNVFVELARDVAAPVPEGVRWTPVPASAGDVGLHR